MRQNFEPKIWGPHAWFFLESVTMAYPTKPSFDEKKAAEQFFNSLQFNNYLNIFIVTVMKEIRIIYMG